MSEETFYGVTLTGQNNTIIWDAISNDDDFPSAQKLVVKQILLGAEAKEEEFNVVEVTCIRHADAEGKETLAVKNSLKIPIAVLKAGETRVVYPDLEFFENTVTFKLIRGNGPVYIHGHNIKDDVEMVMNEEESDDDVAEEEEVDPNPKKKAKLENNADVKNAKNKKK